MEDVIFALLVIVAGALFCFFGYLAFRVIIPLWGALVGFSLGAGAVAAWTDEGSLLALAAIVADLPMVLLVVLSALAGASAITTGIMVLAGTIGTDEFTDEAVTARASDDWWWYTIYLAIALVGIVTQIRLAAGVRGSMRESWAGR